MKRFRFGLATLLILTTITALLVAWVTSHLRAQGREAAVLLRFGDASGIATYSPGPTQTHDGIAFLQAYQEWTGPEEIEPAFRWAELPLYDRVVEIHLFDDASFRSGTNVGELLLTLVELPHLRTLTLHGFSVSDETVKRLKSEMPGCKLVRMPSIYSGFPEGFQTERR